LKNVLASIAVFFFCSVVVACEEEMGTVDVYLLRSPLVDEDPLNTALVTHIHVRISGGGMEPIDKTFPFEPGGAARVPDIPIGQDRVIMVEGLAGEEGYAISRGRSLPMEIDSGDQDLELFIARVGRFSTTPGNGLEQARFGHLTLAGDSGELFLVGGAASGTIAEPEGLLSSIESYHPGSGRIEYHSCGEELDGLCLAKPRAGAAGLILGDSIVVSGGLGKDGLLRDGEIIPLFDSQERAEFVCDARIAGSIVAFDGQGVIAGGLNVDGEAHQTAELVDETGVIGTVELPEPRTAMAVARSAGQGVFFGGFDENQEVTSTLFLFKASTGNFVEQANDVEPRAHAEAVELTDGRVLIIGGLDSSGVASDSVDLFDPRAGVLCNVGHLKRGRRRTAAVELPDKRVLVIGGLTGGDPGEPTSEVEIVDPRYIVYGKSCDDISGDLSTYRVPDTRIRRYESSARLLENQMVVVAGGLDSQDQPIKQLEIFVPED
jgi:hypothetical protein